MEFCFEFQFFVVAGDSYWRVVIGQCRSAILNLRTLQNRTESNFGGRL